uniref:Uncharacterized protein n=1 Tax=Panagrolaimus sp. PS1159 TaxID=55785 RepID=A0AC35FHC4_9BILA
MIFSDIFTFLLIITLFFNGIFALTPEERGELARKFKYYHPSVRPRDKFNLIETLNGTFFNLNTEIELLQTRPLVFQKEIQLELVMIIHYLDDRLIMRELDDVLTIPSEFKPWIPIIAIFPGKDPQQSIHVDPKTGQMTVFYRIFSQLPCFADSWKYPFEKYQCDLYFTTQQDERIFVRRMRDLRPDNQISSVEYLTEEWPYMVFHLFFNSHWHSSIVNVYLPSILIFSVVIFAQWKRRKIQIIVCVAALISIIIMQASQRKYDQITMQDLWMTGILLHLIAILTIDLVLPSRRIIYTTFHSSSRISPKYSPSPARNRRKHSIDHSEQSPLMRYSPPSIRPKPIGGQSVYAYVNPAVTEPHNSAPLPGEDGQSISDALLIRSQTSRAFSSSSPPPPPIKRQITEVTIGTKKRIALSVILVVYAAFFISYCILVFFVLSNP